VQAATPEVALRTVALRELAAVVVGAAMSHSILIQASWRVQ
jgi:hypothetical protein